MTDRNLVEPPLMATLPVGTFRPRRTVQLARFSDGVIVHDRAGQRFFTLAHVAAEIWDCLAAGATPAAIVDQLAAEYDAPRGQIRADVATQIGELLRAGLIEPGPALAVSADRPVLAAGGGPVSPPAPGPGRPIALRPPSYLRCALQIVAIKLRLAAQGYERTLDWIRRRVEAVPASERAAMESVRAAEWRVAMTAALYPGRAQCLERSLALYLLLRCQGVAVRYCHGVQPYPFQAHAWLEYRGEVINDVPERAHQYNRLPEQLP